MPSKKKTSSKKRSRKKTGATRRHAEKKFSFVNWMILLVLIGIFVSFLVYLDKMPPSGHENGQTANIIAAPSGQNTKKLSQAEKRSPEQQFEFYTVLPDREIEVNDYEEDVIEENRAPSRQVPAKQSEPLANTSKPARTETTKLTRSEPTKTAVIVKKPQSVVKSTSSGRALYQLQVGAFKDLAKADAMKARLAFMGVESNIYVIRSANGQNLYRVRVGPNSDEKKLSRIQQQLKAQNINTFMKKLKG